MKRVILAAVLTLLLATLATAAVWACVSDPEGRMQFSGGEPYCAGGGHGCVECVSYDQGGDFMVCIYSSGHAYCYGSIGGHPYHI